MARKGNAHGLGAAGAEEHDEADIVAQGPATYRCLCCNETFPEDELLTVRECSRESCGGTFVATEGNNCPECNNPFTRLVHEAGCPRECGTEDECEQWGPAEQRADFAGRIRGRWQDSVAAILDVGRLLLEAKAALPGEFETMVEHDLPFGPRAARMLIAVAAHPVLSDRNHGSALPSSWRTLYELARLPAPVLQKAIAEGKITAETERKDVKLLAPATVKAVVAKTAVSTPEPKDAPNQTKDETRHVTEIEIADDDPVWLAAQAAGPLVERLLETRSGSLYFDGHLLLEWKDRNAVLRSKVEFEELLDHVAVQAILAYVRETTPKPNSAATTDTPHIEEMAHLMDVPVEMVQQAAFVREHAPDLVQPVERGEMPLPTAFTEATERHARRRA